MADPFAAVRALKADLELAIKHNSEEEALAVLDKLSKVSIASVAAHLLPRWWLSPALLFNSPVFVRVAA